jgi:hypothetical protein
VASGNPRGWIIANTNTAANAASAATSAHTPVSCTRHIITHTAPTTAAAVADELGISLADDQLGYFANCDEHRRNAVVDDVRITRNRCPKPSIARVSGAAAELRRREPTPPKLQCKSGRPGPGSSRTRLRNPASAGYPSQCFNWTTHHRRGFSIKSRSDRLRPNEGFPHPCLRPRAASSSARPRQPRRLIAKAPPRPENRRSRWAH